MGFELKFSLDPAVAIALGGTVATGIVAVWFWIRGRIKSGRGRFRDPESEGRLERRSPPTIIEQPPRITFEPPAGRERRRTR